MSVYRVLFICSELSLLCICIYPFLEGALVLRMFQNHINVYNNKNIYKYKNCKFIQPQKIYQIVYSHVRILTALCINELVVKLYKNKTKEMEKNSLQPI